MASNESNCTSAGCSIIFILGLLYYLFLKYPVTMTIIMSVIVVVLVVGFIMGRQNQKEQEAKRLRAVNLYKLYPYFIEAFYYQKISKKKFQPSDISEHLDELNKMLESVSDSLASKWNQDIIELNRLDELDHNYFISLIEKRCTIPLRKLKRLTTSPAMVLPFNITEELASKKAEDWIAERDLLEKYNEFQNKYKKILPDFLVIHPEFKTVKQILSSEDLLLEYIEKNKLRITYLNWKDNQSTFNNKLIEKGLKSLPGSHVIDREVPIKWPEEEERTNHEDIIIKQFAVKEYSDIATDEQSEEDKKCHNWVKELSFCNSNISNSIINEVYDFVKGCSCDSKEKALIVFVRDNFLSWNEQTISYHLQAFIDKFSSFDSCDAFEFRNKISEPGVEYKNAFVIDIISDEEQASDLCEMLMSPYIINMPNIAYISIIRELTEEEIRGRIEKERIRIEKLKRYDKIAELMPNGLSVWEKTNKTTDRESVVNSESKIMETEISVSLNDLCTYASYYDALGMRVKSCIQDPLSSNKLLYTYFLPLTSSSITKANWSERTGLAIELGGNSNFRSLCFTGLRKTITSELEKSKGQLFSLTPALDSFISHCLDELGLPKDYPWIFIKGDCEEINILVKSGESNDLSIGCDLTFNNSSARLISEDDLFATEDIKGSFSKLRICWNTNQLMPPTLTNKENYGRYYFWMIGIPHTAPVEISITKIDNLIYEFCSETEYKQYVNLGRTFFVAYPKKNKSRTDSSNNDSHKEKYTKTWLYDSESEGALIHKGLIYALGLNGISKDERKAFAYLQKANNMYSWYNLASLIACGLIFGDKASVSFYISQIPKGMKYINVIKNNANYTFRKKTY